MPFWTKTRKLGGLELRRESRQFTGRTARVLLVQMILFHGNTRKACQGPTHARLVCGEMVYSCGRCPLDFQWSVSLCPAWKTSNLVLSKTKAKASVQSFCFILKLYVVQRLASFACIPSGFHLEPSAMQLLRSPGCGDRTANA